LRNSGVISFFVVHPPLIILKDKHNATTGLHNNTHDMVKLESPL